MLKAHHGAKIKVFAVWEPILPTDWQRPGVAVLSRISDPRAHQYWDPDHVLAKRLAADARDPQPKQKCCVRDGVLWDLAAVYPPGAAWDSPLPAAVFFNGPVVKVKAELETVIRGLDTSVEAAR